MTQKRCLDKFPPVNDTIIIEVSRDSIVYKDTTLIVTLPPVTIHDSITVPCPEVPGYIPDTVRAETEYAIAKAWLDPPVLMLRLDQKRSILEFKLDSALKESYYWKEKYQTEKQTIIKEVRHIPKVYKVAMVFSLIVIAFQLGKWVQKIYRTW